VGIFCLAAALQGWLLRATTPPERALLGAAAVALISPGLFTDLAGVGLLVAALAIQSARGRRETVRAVNPSLE
ncbi:MAG: hypothetical protein HY616_15130, partial [Candidatus Rokubacteria bacterium]|nr:hypothetical protein [Candidatus Rokubacteria bacterium]